jgi:2-polyprenyl-6-methoxyphenol hydroxylase-like FAD-dependent oxidoreductase
LRELTITGRFGYRPVFVDRQCVLQVLWERLVQKDKVHVNKRVVKVESTETGVRVHTADKDVFTGDLVVGADGIHSVIRSEMKRIAAEVKPGYFKVDEEKSQQPPSPLIGPPTAPRLRADPLQRCPAI